MESPLHTLCDLFDQLGLPSEVAAIEAFIQRHAPLPAGTVLAEAAIWTSAQADFLREEAVADADWSEHIDTLATLLFRRVG